MPRAQIDPVTIEPDVGKPVSIFVGTTRARDPVRYFSATERGPVSYARFDVTVPPDHRSGSVEVGGREPNPKEDFVVRKVSPFADSSGFRRAVRDTFRANPKMENEAVIFVHGFNNTMADGIFRLSQLMNDLQVPGLPVHFSWPSAANPLGYGYDRDSVLYSRDGLETLIREVSASGANDIVIVAHSMGTSLVMETLRQMAKSDKGSAWNKISGVILMAPDIDIDVFHSQAEGIGDLPQPFIIVTSRKDKILRLSAELTGLSERLGNMASIAPVADLDVTVVDVSEFGDSNSSHTTALGSPSLLRLIRNADKTSDAFGTSAAARPGLLPGTVMTLQNATAVIIQPNAAK